MGDTKKEHALGQGDKKGGVRFSMSRVFFGGTPFAFWVVNII